MAINDQEIAAIINWLGGELKENSEEERAAMRAVARVLREEKLPRDFRFALADHFDPDLRDTVELGFVLKPTRGRGRPQTVNERKLAVLVWRRIEKEGDQKKQHINTRRTRWASAIEPRKRRLRNGRNIFGDLGLRCLPGSIEQSAINALILCGRFCLINSGP